MLTDYLLAASQEISSNKHRAFRCLFPPVLDIYDLLFPFFLFCTILYLKVKAAPNEEQQC